MRRRGFGIVGMALAIVVVFAPRPAGPEMPSRPDAERAWLAGRVLAPAIDAATLRDSSKQIGDPIPSPWWICLILAAGLALRRHAFRITDSLVHRRLVGVATARGCRAPPPVPA